MSATIRTAPRALGLGAVLPPGAFRLLLAAAVVVSHLSNFDIGRPAVLLFFYLSGYWTASLWAKRFQGDVRRFYVSRYLRIAPLYLLAVAAAVLATGARFGVESISLLGIASSNLDPLGVSWSLDVELQYYLLLPLLWPAFATPRLAVLASAVLAVFGWIFASATGVVTVLQYLPVFVLGALTYTSDWRPSAPVALSGAGLFVIISALTPLTAFAFKTTPDPFDRDIFGFFWVLPLLPLVALSLRVKSDPLDRALGNLSYPLYLVHYPIIVLVTGWLGGGLLSKGLAAGVALAVALAAYIVLDRPIDRWRVQITEKPA